MGSPAYASSQAGARVCRRVPRVAVLTALGSTLMLAIVLVLAVLPSSSHAQDQATVQAKDLDPDLIGVVDLQRALRTDPDFRPRILNDIDLARLARRKGLRAIVLKNHYTMSADRAELVMEEVGGIEVFGGLVLNRAIGGLNPDALPDDAEHAGKARADCLAADVGCGIRRRPEARESSLRSDHDRRQTAAGAGGDFQADRGQRSRACDRPLVAGRKSRRHPGGQRRASARSS